jgi:aspartate/methionine/tyrosine aminotransferase
VRLAPFLLEHWIAEHENKAECVIGTSGVASASLREIGGEAPDPATLLDYGEVPGEPVLTKAVARYEGVPEEEILLTVGGTEADFLVFLALSGPGDHVLVERPVYWPLEGVPRAFGCRVESVPRRFEEGFRLDPDAVKRRLMRGTKLVVLANPNNPTGVMVPNRDLVEIAEACAEVGALLVVDEIFRELARNPTPSAYRLHPSIVVTQSLTKCFGLSGLRAGWILARPDLRAQFREAKALTTITNPVIDQHLAAKAVDNRERLLARARGIRDENWRLLSKRLDGQSFFRWVDPDGGVMVAPKLPEGVDDVAFAERLLREESTLVSPGSYLGAPGHIRLGFGQPPAKFAEGLARLERFVARAR